MADDEENQEPTPMGPFMFGMSPEALAQHEEMHKRQQEEMARNADRFLMDIHEFLDSLNQQQLRMLYKVLFMGINQGKKTMSELAGQVSGYLVVKYKFFAQTDAAAGEKIGLTDFDPNKLLEEDGNDEATS